LNILKEITCETLIKSGLNNNITIKPDLRDLYLLDEYVVLNKRISVLEFGCGWSIQIIANALKFVKVDLNIKI